MKLYITISLIFILVFCQPYGCSSPMKELLAAAASIPTNLEMIPLHHQSALYSMVLYMVQ